MGRRRRETAGRDEEELTVKTKCKSFAHGTSLTAKGKKTSRAASNVLN
ncbi:hypothetical protein CCACVL1_02830 [Corchorus capsularis]|uniref:Uncharacterized protein n=1 Tax=Corchorus capsularis TaxID=210143 RepID=A0A1R3K5F8_COCAP|nr:hypothetical protein CCACVL1_02830 [Corchorus capsularis]